MGEAIDNAWWLLKQGFEHPYPPTQGPEPTDEYGNRFVGQYEHWGEMPIVDAKMKDYESECECAENQRDELVQQLMMITEIVATPEDKSQIEEYIDFLQQASCQELLQVEIIRGKCDKDTGFDQADQMKYAGEPMDIAMRLFKSDFYFPSDDEEFSYTPKPGRVPLATADSALSRNPYPHHEWWSHPSVARDERIPPELITHQLQYADILEAMRAADAPMDKRTSDIALDELVHQDAEPKYYPDKYTPMGAERGQLVTQLGDIKPTPYRETYWMDDPSGEGGTWEEKNASEPMNIAMRLLKNEEQWRQEAKFSTNEKLEDESTNAPYRMSMHENSDAFREAGYPWDRIEEFFGSEIAEADKKAMIFSNEWKNREEDEDEQLREMGLYEERGRNEKGSINDWDYAPDVFMEHGRHNIRNLPSGGHTHETVPAFGNVNIRTPAPVDEHQYGVKVGRDMQKYPLLDMEEQRFSPWQTDSEDGNLRNTRQGGFSAQDQMKYTSEPMDIAMRLLKEEIDYENQIELAPHEQLWNDEADDDLKEKTNALWEYIESMHPQDKLMMLNQMNNPMLAMGINKDPRNRADMTDEETKKYINDAIWEMMFDAWQDSALEMPGGIDYDLGSNRKSGEPGDPVRAHAIDPSQWKKLASEPMDITMRLLKDDEEDEDAYWASVSKIQSIIENRPSPTDTEAYMAWIQELENVKNEEGWWELNPKQYPPEFSIADPSKVIGESTVGMVQPYPEQVMAEKQEGMWDEDWQEDMKGEPMDIAMRLLKAQRLYDALPWDKSMQSFEQAYFLIKSDDMIDLLIKMGRQEDALQMRNMRQFVLENQNSTDPGMREAADEMYQYLTQLQSYLGGDKTGESPQMPQVAGFNAPPLDPPRPREQEEVTGAHEEIPPEHPLPLEDENPMKLKSNPMDIAWTILKNEGRLCPAGCECECHHRGAAGCIDCVPKDNHDDYQPQNQPPNLDERNLNAYYSPNQHDDEITNMGY